MVVFEPVFTREGTYCLQRVLAIAILFVCPSVCHTGGSVNKKSELMLMRRTRAHSSSCSQVILVYLHPFHRNSLLCSHKSPKNHQNPYF